MSRIENWWIIASVFAIVALTVALVYKELYLFALLMALPFAVFDLLYFKISNIFIRFNLYFIFAWIFLLILSFIGYGIPSMGNYTFIDWIVIVGVSVYVLYLIEKEKAGAGDIAVLSYVLVNPFVSAVSLFAVGFLSTLMLLDREKFRYIPLFGMFIICGLAAYLCLPVLEPHICDFVKLSSVEQLKGCSKILY